MARHAARCQPRRSVWCAARQGREYKSLGGTGMTRVVAILAHPDDAEILAGGTLYKHRQRGDSVAICSVTYTLDSERGQEGATGAERLGAEFTCLGLPDMAVSHYTPADVERLTAFLLARPPDLVLTHWLEDPHPDHVASVRLVIEA